MSNLNKKLIAIAILPFLLAGCGEEQNTSSGTSSSDSTGKVFNLFGVKAVDSAYKALILSATDGYASTVVTDAYVSSSDINAGLINNNGTNDTIDVEIKGVASGSLMLQAGEQKEDFSSFESGYLEFNIRSKSAVPDDLTVAIDNGWPNRKVFSLNGYVNFTNDWEGISIPIKCMKPGSGMSDFSLDSVATPFFMESSKAYSYEITDIAYKEKSEFTPVVDATSCKKSVNDPAPLVAGDLSIYYTGDDSLATDISSKYPLADFGGTRTESGGVVHFSLPANGGVFFQAASGDELNLSSFYAAGFLTIDIKIDNYGTSPNLEIKLEDVDPGTSNDTKYLINNGLIPANSSWYRCNLPVSSLALDGSYLSSTSKAAYLSGEWDKMVGLDFSFTNVALINSRNISGASDCVQL
ncbi:putative glycoside hydrolase [Vibrio sp. Hal054]|uniref:putative glycoside hydrolase n=1 Tax=Vibrio sp. Hal054 TaxID=3035158 RepID=UPI00301C94A3